MSALVLRLPKQQSIALRIGTVEEILDVETLSAADEVRPWVMGRTAGIAVIDPYRLVV